MIFSSVSSETVFQNDLIDTDTFCLFPCANAIILPEAIFWVSVLSSLKMKKNVLILESPLQKGLPTSTQRWMVGHGFLWLAPRAYSTIFEAYSHNSMNYSDLRNFLLIRK